MRPLFDNQLRSLSESVGDGENGVVSRLQQLLPRVIPSSLNCTMIADEMHDGDEDDDDVGSRREHLRDLSLSKIGGENAGDDWRYL